MTLFLITSLLYNSFLYSSDSMKLYSAFLYSYLSVFFNIHSSIYVELFFFLCFCMTQTLHSYIIPLPISLIFHSIVPQFFDRYSELQLKCKQARDQDKDLRTKVLLGTNDLTLKVKKVGEARYQTKYNS